MEIPSPGALKPSGFCNGLITHSRIIAKDFEHRSTLIPPSLRGLGPYGPYGFRLVDRAYSSERPEATFMHLDIYFYTMRYALCPMP